MSLTVFEIVLVAAVLHASWNAIVKAGKNTVLIMVLVTASAALWAVVLLPVLPQAQKAGPILRCLQHCKSSILHWSQGSIALQT